MSNTSPWQATEIDINECKERYDNFIKQLAASAHRQGILSILCLIPALILLFLSVNGIGVALLIASAYFWQEANKAEMQGNVVVALYPLALLVNSHTSDLKAIKADVQILTTRFGA